MANYTQQLIIETFESMVERMPFDKITVTALITECNIGRNTFYYHYEDIYALLDDMLIRVLRKYDAEAQNKDLREVLISFLYACRENQKKVYNIFNSLSRDRLERYIFEGTESMITDRVLKMAAERNVSMERAEVVVNIVRYSIYGFFMQFLWDSMKDDIEQSVDKLDAVYNEMLDYLLR